MRHDLPSGGWVDLRDPTTLKAKHTKQVMRSIKDFNTEQPVEAGLSMTDGLIALLVTDWSLPYDTDEGRAWQLPREDVSMVDELSAADYMRLTALIKPAQEVLMPSNPDPSDYGNPDSPTVPASA